jgi:hypothetical protein
MEKNSKVISSAIGKVGDDILSGAWESNHRETITDMLHYTEWAYHKFGTMNSTLDDFANSESEAFVAKFNEQNDLPHNQGERPLIIRVRDLAGAMRDNHYRLPYNYFSVMRKHVTMFLFTVQFMKGEIQGLDSDVKMISDLREKEMCLGHFIADAEWYDDAAVNPCSYECVHDDKTYAGFQSKANSRSECIKWNSPEIAQQFQPTFSNNETMRWNHNYCRNPNNDKKGPWCFVSKAGDRNHCNIDRTCTMPSCCRKIRLKEGRFISPFTTKIIFIIYCS